MRRNLKSRADHGRQALAVRSARRDRRPVVEMLEPRRLLSVTPSFIEQQFVPAAPVVRPALLRAADSAPITDPTQAISVDLATGTERVFAAHAGAPSQAQLDQILADSLRQQGFSSLNEFIASIGTPAGMFQLSAGVSPKAAPDGRDASGVVRPKTVHGNDDRILVTDTTVYPFNTVGRLEMTFPDSSSGFGSGAMISPYHFLTAGHCVHSASNGGWATSVTVTLGQDGSNRWYGTANGVLFRSYVGWTRDQDTNHDWALVTLDRRIGDITGWMGYESRGNLADFNGLNLNTAGYPGDLSDGERMYRAFGPTTSATDTKVSYSGLGGLDTFGGQSGSGMWRFDGTNRYINVVHTNGGSTWNTGTRINRDKFDRLGTWRSEDDQTRPPTDRPDLVDYDQWFSTSFANFSPAKVSPGGSFSVTAFPRNNGTAAAGAFVVRYRLSTDTSYDVSDTFLGDAEISSLSPLNFAAATLTIGDFPAVDAGRYHVVWSIDPFGQVGEFVEGDNFGYTGTTIDVAAAVVNGSISGRLWNDANGNKSQDSGESGLASWRVFLDADGDGAFDSSERSVLTNSAGEYVFADVVPGSYTVAEVVPSGWTQTFPGGATSGRAANGGIDPAAQRFWENAITSTGTADVAAHVLGERVAAGGVIRPLLQQSSSLIRMDEFRKDQRFAGIDGKGFSSVIIDTGIDRNHPFFGPDADKNGIADRIVFSYDFSDGNDPDATDFDGHGSHVAGIVGSQDAVHRGMAPGSGIIALKVFGDSAWGASGTDIEEALQWVVQNASKYGIASVNLSLGAGNFNTVQTSSWTDEFAALAAMNVLVVAASGNSFFGVNSVQGVANVAAEANVIAVGSTYDADVGQRSYGSGATDFTTAADRISSFSQRSTTLLDVFAPGALIESADQSGGTVVYSGTSMASPHIAGIATLAQQLAVSRLGRRLSLGEFTDLLKSTGVTVVDGDDENDNVTNTNGTFKRVDMLSLATKIWDMGGGSVRPGVHVVTVSSGQNVTGINFGNRVAAVPSISVRGGGLTIASGDSSPVLDDGTHFGSVNMAKGLSNRTFVISNPGTAALQLTGKPAVQILGANAQDFRILSQPSGSVAAGATSRFVVQFNPIGSGVRNATLRITSNAPGNPVYEFAINGFGISSPTVLAQRILDDGDATSATGSFSATGTWSRSTGSAGYAGDVRSAAKGSGSTAVSWTFDSVASGKYTVYVRWVPGSTLATNAPYDILDGASRKGTVRLNQRRNPSTLSFNGFMWQKLGTYTMTKGTVTVRLTNAANGTVVADAARLVQVDVPVSAAAGALAIPTPAPVGKPVFATGGSMQPPESRREVVAPVVAASFATFGEDPTAADGRVTATRRRPAALAADLPSRKVDG